MSTPTITNKKRLVLVLFFCSLCLLILTVRIGWIQIVNGEKYKQLALEQQTRDIPIPAKRGTIYDRKGKELAVSASTNTVWARPVEVEKSGKLDETAKKLSEILEMDEEEVRKTIF